MKRILIRLVVILMLGGAMVVLYDWMKPVPVVPADGPKMNPPSATTEPSSAKLSIPTDELFAKGFVAAGVWPLTDEEIQRTKDHPMCVLRETYCQRIGYQYADFGCDCFVYQYFDTYRTYQSPDNQFKFYYPLFWNIDSPANDLYTKDATWTAKRTGASCAIVRGRIDEDVLSTHKAVTKSQVQYGIQASGGQEIVSGDDGLTKYAVAFDRPLTGSERAAGYVPFKRIAIAHFPFPSSSTGFLLTSGETQPLTEACVSEFDDLLNSRSLSYPEGALSNASSGILYGQNTQSWFESYAEIPQKRLFLFDNAVTKQTESILENRLASTKSFESPLLTNNKIYYLDGVTPTFQLRTLDLFTGQQELVPLPLTEGETLHHFLIRGEEVYYLEGNNCNEYLMKCNLKLVRYNLKTGLTERLAQNVASRLINGFDAKGNLVLAWWDGDAGCYWASFESYDFSEKQLTLLGSESVCEGDPENEKLVALEELAQGLSQVHHLVIKDGKIYRPTKDDQAKFANGFLLRLYSSEIPISP